MYKLDFWEANTSQKTSFGRFVDTILTGEHAGAPGGRNVDFIEVLAIPVAQAAVRRHRATLEGEADFRPRRPRGIVNYDASASSRI